jgi:hypothetical protein
VSKRLFDLLKKQRAKAHCQNCSGLSETTLIRCAALFWHQHTLKGANVEIRALLFVQALRTMARKIMNTIRAMRVSRKTRRRMRRNATSKVKPKSNPKTAQRKIVARKSNMMDSLSFDKLKTSLYRIPYRELGTKKPAENLCPSRLFVQIVQLN